MNASPENKWFGAKFEGLSSTSRCQVMNEEVLSTSKVCNKGFKSNERKRDAGDSKRWSQLLLLIC